MKTAINVLHLSTHDEECGIAVFQENVVNGMGKKRPINNVFFEISPNKLKILKGKKLDEAINKLYEQLKDFDILHIQHEYSFYNDDQLQRIVDKAKQLKGKKILITLHTPPHARREHYNQAKRTLNPRSWLAIWRLKKARKLFIDAHIKPLHKADLLIVLSQASKDSFAEYGVPKERMRIIELPIPKVNTAKTTNEIAEALNKQTGDIILSTVGFLSENKGAIPAVKSLMFLPSNYKLAIIGGSHPSGQNDRYYDKVCDLIYKLNLQQRVYITGYVADSDRMDALARETDIAVYPYDKDYYDYVSSAALNNAVANNLPIVAYKTRTFEEANSSIPFLNFCHSANYYELARVIRNVDLSKSAELTKQYADAYSVEKQADLFAECYKQLFEAA